MQNNPTPEKEESVEELANKYAGGKDIYWYDEDLKPYPIRTHAKDGFIAGYNAHKQRMGEVVKEALQAGYSVLTGNETPNELDLVIRAIKLVADALPQPPKTT